MKIHKIIIAFFLITLYSCGQSNEKYSNDYKWEECVFMPNIYLFENMSPNVDTMAVKAIKENYPYSFYGYGQKKEHFKLIALVYGDCGSCFGKLEEWENYISTYKKQLNDVSFAAVVHTENVPVLEYNLDKLNSTLPIYIDTMSYFLQSNNITTGIQGYVLLDSTNAVLHSNITDSYEVKKEFKKMMKIIDNSIE